jgi:peroxiredoxin
LGDYRFPTRIAWSCFTTPTNRPPESFLAMTGQVTAVSFKIPESIPTSTFRLDESIAPRIWYGGQTKGFGVGLLLAESGSNVVVRRIFRDSPAAAQNQLHVGDHLLAIAESNAPPVPVHAGNADLPRAMARFRGPKGTAIRLTFVPAGQDDSRAQCLTLVRGNDWGWSASHSELTNGMKAPNIAMINLANRATEHLSDYASKIVVLEFWATWCAPCRKNLADLQLASSQYPQWKDKVVVLAASTDDTADLAARFIAEKGWNQTHNVWLPSLSIKSYFVGGIPYAYVIDAQGTITASGNPPGPQNIADQVNHLLDTSPGRNPRSIDFFLPHRLPSGPMARAHTSPGHRPGKFAKNWLKG